MATRNRGELKAYFVKNAIPTEGNFADLIDSQLNQAQDGVFKPDGQPLSVVAAPGDQKRVLRLYGSYPAANPDWMLSLSPAQDPANPATSRAGLGVTDGAGNLRLFVDAATGRVGVGTNNPQSALDVAGGVRIGGAIVPSVGNSESAGIQFPNDPGGGNGDRAFIRYFVESGESTKLLIGNNNDADDRVSLYQMGAERLTVYNGCVGINNSNPGAALDILAVSQTSSPRWWEAIRFSQSVDSAITLPSGGLIFGFNNTVSQRGWWYGDTRLNRYVIMINADTGGLYVLNGSLYVSGGKFFQIDHPLKPDHHLVHSAIEGPEAAVFYRGEAALQAGECEIALPTYFEALTYKEDRTVLLTPKLSDGEETSTLAAGAVVGGRFRVRAIDGRNLRQRFYWEVKAVRGDIARIEVEPAKTEVGPSSLRGPRLTPA